MSTSIFAGVIQSLFLRFRHVQGVKGLSSELIYGDIGVEIPTYVRNDNPDAPNQVDSVNTAQGENAQTAL